VTRPLLTCGEASPPRGLQTGLPGILSGTRARQRQQDADSPPAMTVLLGSG
jgi:hypothetical protein